MDFLTLIVACTRSKYLIIKYVDEVGIEPTQPEGDRFTVCSSSPTLALIRSVLRKGMGLNHRPRPRTSVPSSDALNSELDLHTGHGQYTTLYQLSYPPKYRLNLRFN